MAIRYDAEFLLHLQSSPLCVKPSNLPPREEYMGPPQDTARVQIKTTSDRFKLGDFGDQAIRKAGVERHIARSGGGSDGIVLGPPRTNFASASSKGAGRSGETDRIDKSFRDSDARSRFFQNRTAEGDTNDRFRDGRSSNYRRRGDSDQDSEGWSTVKPRKSFGQDGAERFNGRMGGGERYRDDREMATKDRARRLFEHDGDELDAPRRNGLSRGKSDPWFKDGSKSSDPGDRPSQRAKSWRERDPDDKPGDSRNDRGHDRQNRRWDRDRDQRVERDPEWLDEPVEEENQTHTEEDFKKFMESMKAGRGGAKMKDKSNPAPETPSASVFFDLTAETAAKSTSAAEKGPDKFFAAFEPAASPTAEARTEAAKARGGKSSSRFTSFFSSQGGEGRGQAEPVTPAAAAPPTNGGQADPQQADEEKEREAFQALIQKLQRQSLQATPTPPNNGGYAAAPPPQSNVQNISPSIPPPALQSLSQGIPQSVSQNITQSFAQQKPIASPDTLQQFAANRREEPRLRSVPPPIQEIHAPRPMQPPPQPPSTPSEQMIQNLLDHRQNAPSQGGGRVEPQPSGNSQTEFLMQLMRSAPEPPRIEQILMRRMPHPQKQPVIPQMQEREADFARERAAHPRPIRAQGPGPASFLEDRFGRSESETRPIQPTQILQRPPPGLDHSLQQPWAPAAAPMHPPQRPMIPPPGLVGNPNRNVPIPGLFPPNFPPGAFPPEGMAGPPRNMQPPPGFFGVPPPPGPAFIHPLGMGGFQGPDAMGFVPFDGRTMPPPGPGGPFRRS